jgi:hypothetical protein
MSIRKVKPDGPRMGRINAVLPAELVARISEARARLRMQGIPVSASSFVEVAATELLARRDLAEVLKRRGATAKRP